MNTSESTGESRGEVDAKMATSTQQEMVQEIEQEMEQEIEQEMEIAMDTATDATMDGALNTAIDPTRHLTGTHWVEDPAGQPHHSAELSRALAASQHQLRAARQQIEVLQAEDAVLKQRVIQLTHTAALAHHFSNHDQLTGLPSRTLLLDRFQQAVARAERQHRQVALLFVDLDQFNRINDSLGHQAGDQVLQQVAARLNGCIRASDTACRYGGDEFVLLLPDLDGRDSALVVAKKLHAQFVAPYLLSGLEVQLTASIGLALYPVDGKEYIELLQKSDSAMYRDKNRAAALPAPSP